jgi:hypothetical protein
MTQRNPYVKVYYSIVDDERFAGVYKDDRALATWLRLLISADASWPASAPIPRWCKPVSLQKLVSSGLVEVQADHYRIHGLDAERDGRHKQVTEAGRIRAQKGQRDTTGRWTIGGDGVPAPDQRPSTGGPASQLNSTQLNSAHSAGAREGLPDITPEVQEVGEGITGQGILSAGDKQLTELDRLCGQHGDGALIDAFRRVADGETKSWRQLVWDSMKLLEPFASSQDTQDTQKAERSQEAEAADKERWRKSRARNKERAEELGMS